MNLRNSRIFIGLAIFLIATRPISAADKPKPLWLVVTRPMFADAVKPLAEARRRDGFETAISTDAIDESLAKLPRTPRCLLLVGDEATNNDNAPWRIASKHLDLYRWREVQRMQYASDPALTDRNNDGIPDFPVGRIPARTKEQVELAVRKTLDFEKQTPTIRDLDLNVWSGSPLYGAMIDRMANGLLLTMIQTQSPAWVQPWIVMGDPMQAFCGWPADQPSRFLGQMHDGGLLHVFIGHGNSTGILAMVHNDKPIFLNTRSGMEPLKNGPPSAPLVLLTCDAGRFDGPQPSLAETLYFMPGGPVATIAATTESHPLTNYFTGRELLKSLGGRRRRVGDQWLAVQKRARTARDFVMEPVLRDVEGKLEDEINVGKLRHDQMLMYNLLGDPATKLRLPQKLKVKVTPDGDTWRWHVDRPARATRLEVAYRPSPITLPAATTLPADRKAANAALDAANRCFEYCPIASLDADKPWNGTIDTPGMIRFVAMGGDKIFVATCEAAPAPTHQAPATQN